MSARMTIAAASLLTVAALGVRASVAPQAQQARAHRFTKVTDDIYLAVGNGSMNVGANSPVIINEQDVLIVDSHITPAAARALIEDIRTLTPKPVRFVVDTHFHFDHAHGNQIFPPDVQVIGHEFTRQMLLGNVLESRSYRSFVDPVPQQIETLRKQAAGEADATKRAELRRQADVQQAYLEALKEIRPTPPNVTLSTKMTLHRGAREIQLHFFGRGHTGGDVVVFLPKERIVCTGDLLTAGLSFMGDAFADEWPATLEKVKQLDFDTVLPGHGDVFKGKERLTYFQGYLRDAWSEVAALKKQGVPAAEAAKRVDLTRHKANFPAIQGPGMDPRGAVRMYEVMDGQR